MGRMLLVHCLPLMHLGAGRTVWGGAGKQRRKGNASRPARGLASLGGAPILIPRGRETQGGTLEGAPVWLAADVALPGRVTVGSVLFCASQVPRLLSGAI